MYRHLSVPNIHILIGQDEEKIDSNDPSMCSLIYEVDEVNVSISAENLIHNNEVKDESMEKRTITQSSGIQREFFRFRGIICILIGSILFSIVTTFVKMLAEMGMDPFAASFWRYVGILTPSIPILAFRTWLDFRRRRCTMSNSRVDNDRIFDTIWPLGKTENQKNIVGLLSRGLIASTAVILRYYALQYLSVGDMLVIVYASPILVSAMAHFCLGEDCGVVPIIVAFTTLGGLVLVAKPPFLTGAGSFDTDTLMGTSYAIGALFCSAVIVIITRKIRKVDFSLMLVTFGAIGVVQAGAFEFFMGTGSIVDMPKDVWECLLVAGLATCAFFGQVAVIMALKYEQAGPVALLRSSEVVFGYFLQYMFLSVVPDIWSGVGATIVVTGVVIVASRKWIKDLSQESRLRRFMGWVLY